jgi:hypothetical protein
VSLSVSLLGAQHFAWLSLFDSLPPPFFPLSLSPSASSSFSSIPLFPRQQPSRHFPSLPPSLPPPPPLPHSSSQPIRIYPPSAPLKKPSTKNWQLYA